MYLCKFRFKWCLCRWHYVFSLTPLIMNLAKFKFIYTFLLRKSLMILCIISSAGASSPAVPTNVGSRDGSSHGHGSRAASLSCVGSQPPRTSLSTSAGGSAFGSSRPSCRPWERGDLLRRLATFKPLNWFGKPKVWTWLGHEILSVNLFVICDLWFVD